MPEPTRGYRLGADIGGTFTDLVLAAPDGRFWTKKVPSTTDDYGRGIVEGLRQLLEELGIEGTRLAEVVHGTTVATNAILEYKGAKTALLTTRGFRDVLELRRVRAPELYNPRYTPPRPMVERRLRLEVDERVGARGGVVRPLDEASVRAALKRVRGDGARAVAVCFLHAYANPAHERRVGEIVREELPGVYLSLSVDVLPEIREYDRTSTTVINAYIGPIVETYLRSLRRQLAETGVGAPLLIMQSNGGVMTAEAAAAKPAQIVESGPAAGVIAGHRLAERAGIKNLITFDMGGTTAKASLVEDGRLTQTTEYEVGAGISLSSRLVKGGGHALKLPVIDIAEVGAGGGSIVWIDRGGALRVGPRSAGAQPGPACYDMGGEEPTITDANVVLGYLNASVLAGGAVRLAPELAARAIETTAARPLGLGLREAAHGVYTVAITNMIRAVKAVSTYRGRDPRDFALLAFGGNGPIFGAEMARALGMRTVLVPPAAGLFSAFGLLEADLEQHLVQTFLSRADEVDLAALNETYCGLEARARIEGREMRDEEDRSYSPPRSARVLAPRPSILRRYADLRYAGQGYELTVPAPDGPLGAAEVAALVERFGDEHERTYGHKAADEPIELVNLRLVAAVERERPPLRDGLVASADRGRESWRDAYFGPEHGLHRTPVIGRAALTTTPRLGPLIIDEYDATTVVPPNCTARLDEWGNIVIEVSVQTPSPSGRGLG
jgi:N-methylhydantoinase A